MKVESQLQIDFDHPARSCEILANPSVKVEDEVRTRSQAARMRRLFFAALKTGTLVSSTALIELAGQYQARLYELRRALLRHKLCIDRIVYQCRICSRYIARLPRDKICPRCSAPVRYLHRVGKPGLNYYTIVKKELSVFYLERRHKLNAELMSPRIVT